jgi:hypothetical protein
MKKAINDIKLHIIKIYKRFTRHNATSRIFIVLVYTIWALTFKYTGDFWSDVFFYFFAVFILSFITLFVFDKHFRKGARAFINSGFYPPDKPGAPTETRALTQQDFFDIVAFIKEISIKTYDILIAKVMGFLTRFPFFENYGLNKLSHYRYNNIRQFCHYLEDNSKYFIIEGISIDNYYYNVTVRSNKSLSSNLIQKEIKKEIEDYLNKEADGVFIRPQGHKAQIMIPLEYLSP